jgi:hypothetical protein
MVRCYAWLLSEYQTVAVRRAIATTASGFISGWADTPLCGLVVASSLAVLRAFLAVVVQHWRYGCCTIISPRNVTVLTFSGTYTTFLR